MPLMNPQIIFKLYLKITKNCTAAEWYRLHASAAST